jgi:hypothetical protein
MPRNKTVKSEAVKTKDERYHGELCLEDTFQGENTDNNSEQAIKYLEQEEKNDFLERYRFPSPDDVPYIGTDQLDNIIGLDVRHPARSNGMPLQCFLSVSELAEHLVRLGVAKERSLRYAQQMESMFHAMLRGADIGPFLAPQPVNAELTLPEQAPKLYAKRSNIIDFLRDPEGWGPYVKAGTLTRPDLRRLDPQAAIALDNWLRNNTLPPDIRIPKKSEVIDLAQASFPDSASRPAHIDWAMRRRAQRVKNNT